MKTADYFKNLISELGSRKLAVAAAGLLAALNLPNVDPAQRLWAVVAVVGAYLIGQGVADLKG